MDVLLPPVHDVEDGLSVSPQADLLLAARRATYAIGGVRDPSYSQRHSEKRPLVFLTVFQSDPKLAPLGSNLGPDGAL